MKFEILAPAGSSESLVAGVRSGANAVYLGGKSFNARRNAGNFNDEELKRACEYCKQRGVKVYLTLNILLSDDELEEAYDTAQSALEAGVDAFIVQDIGTAKMLREHFHGVRLHGSTQMSIMTPAGAKAARDMGFSRIVLPREMSREEIKEIRQSTDLELEMFVHGALCMSVSGQCQLSAMIGSRSGNRGLCAQPCRLEFSAGGGSHALSLKDLSLIGELKELEGITSLKIEGRMKRPEYVSAAVCAVKKAIEGKYCADDGEILKSVFSRSGFTDGYFNSRLGRDMFGIRQKEDVTAARGVLGELARAYEKEKPLVALDMSFECSEGKPARLIARALGKSVEIIGEAPQKAVNKPLTEQVVIQRLSKLGGTQFYAGNVSVNLGEGLIISAAGINEMRRKAVEGFNIQPKAAFECKPFEIALPSKKACKAPYAAASFRSAAQIPDRHPFKRVFIPIDSTLEDFVDNRAGVVLPRGLFGIEGDIAKRLEKLKRAGVTKALCGNIGSYTLAKDMGFEVFGDFGLNIFNSVSAGLINSPVLSFELTARQLSKICADEAGALVYGRLPLMLMRNCPVKNDIGCNKCGKNGRLTDRTGAEFPVICSNFPCSELLNSVPLYMLDRLDEIKTDFHQFYFSVESKKQVEHIISLYESREKPDFKFTRGLYKRGVL